MRGVNKRLIAGNNFMIIRDSFVIGVDYCVYDDRNWPENTAPTPNKYPKKGRNRLRANFIGMM